MEDTMQSQLMCVSVFAAYVCQGGGVHVISHRIFFLIFIFLAAWGLSTRNLHCIMQDFLLQRTDSLWCADFVAPGHVGS